MSFILERSLIETHFATQWAILRPSWDFTREGQVGYDDQSFMPPVGSQGVNLTILSGDADQISVGSPGTNAVRHAGIVTVEIYSPSDEGSATIRAIADDVETVFINQILTDSSTTWITMLVPGVLARQIIEPFLVWTMATPFQRDVFNG